MRNQEHQTDRLKLEAGASDDAGSLRQENLGMTKDNTLMRDDNVRKEASLKQLPAELGKLTAINHARKSLKKTKEEAEITFVRWTCQRGKTEEANRETE